MEREISRQFNLIATDYDKDRPKFIPCFDDFYCRTTTILAKLIDKPTPRFLDLGSGTGLLTAYWLLHFPTAKYDLIDISDKMLDIAKDRFRNQTDLTFINRDYVKEFPNIKYDVVISALSLHHLEKEQKESLYSDIFSHLNNGGWFINYDQFKMNDEKLEKSVEKDWCHSIIDAGIDEQNFLLMKERRNLDRETTVEEEINLLEKQGFKDISCIFRYFKFGVIITRRR